MEKEIIVLTGSGLFDFGFWIGAGACTGVLCAFGMYAAVVFVLDKLFPGLKLI